MRSMYRKEGDSRKSNHVNLSGSLGVRILLLMPNEIVQGTQSSAVISKYKTLGYLTVWLSIFGLICASMR